MSSSPGADWDATRYHQVAQPHAAWGSNVLDRLQLAGDEVVLDAGCGSGRVTAQLLERLPRGRVIGADRRRPCWRGAQHAGALRRTRHVRPDRPARGRHGLAAHALADAIFSTATFHWIDDHARLFAALHRVVKPGRRLASQFGGGANLAGFMRATDAIAARPAYVDDLQGKPLWRFYYSPEQTQSDLSAPGSARSTPGFSPRRRPSRMPRAWPTSARAVVLRNHLNALPART